MMIKMRIKLIILLVAVLLSSSTYGKEKSIQKVIKESMKVVEAQTLSMADKLKKKKDQLPRSSRGRTDIITSDSHWWCSGFYPGTLWYLYEYKKKENIRMWAEMYTDRVEQEKFTTDNHDIGFILNCSFGNGYRLTKNPRYVEILTTGARSLSTRFRPVCGCIQSWDLDEQKRADGWQIPVIIDNMMNLELLLWASKQTGDQSFYNIAVSHANTTLKNHFRPDFSSYHVVSYDSISGKADKRFTFQGYSDESAWARGQGWGLYSFTFMYANTGIKRYLEQAKKIASFIIYNPNLPADKIPYWDFNAPDIPKALRDASAGALIASALVQLSEFVDEPLRAEYLKVAETQIRTLSSPVYLAKPGTNGSFILKHSVGFLNKDSEVDAPLTYADYYYVEAMVKYNKLLKKK
ncbi:MAG: glycoside hydrolase family 88 protein [Bacteroidales bacterium]|nr:glycoside hydrolase family 88 protein [Bacteroidales bacterium]